MYESYTNQRCYVSKGKIADCLYVRFLGVKASESANRDFSVMTSYCLLGCDAMESFRRLQACRRNDLPPYFCTLNNEAVFLSGASLRACRTTLQNSSMSPTRPVPWGRRVSVDCLLPSNVTALSICFWVTSELPWVGIPKFSK